MSFHDYFLWQYFNFVEKVAAGYNLEWLLTYLVYQSEGVRVGVRKHCSSFAFAVHTHGLK